MAKGKKGTNINIKGYAVRDVRGGWIWLFDDNQFPLRSVCPSAWRRRGGGLLKLRQFYPVQITIQDRKEKHGQAKETE
jgi:hypothetical protein